MKRALMERKAELIHSVSPMSSAGALCLLQPYILKPWYGSSTRRVMGPRTALRRWNCV